MPTANGCIGGGIGPLKWMAVGEVSWNMTRGGKSLPKWPLGEGGALSFDADGSLRPIRDRAQEVGRGEVVPAEGQAIEMPRGRIGSRGLDSKSRRFLQLRNEAIVRPIDVKGAA